ncbi:MAG: hypothetical protein ACYC5O_00800 [Anaerolineae bacterium]
MTALVGLPLPARQYAALLGPMLEKEHAAAADALEAVANATDADTVQWREWLTGRQEQLEGVLAVLKRSPERTRWVRGLEARTP